MPVPSAWGPHLWRGLHHIAAQYPLAPKESDLENYAQFFELLAKVLPCSTCKFHFEKLLRNDPVRPWLESREHLSEWLWRAHNTVNRKTGKPAIPFSFITSTYGVSKPIASFRSSLSNSFSETNNTKNNNNNNNNNNNKNIKNKENVPLVIKRKETPQKMIENEKEISSLDQKNSFELIIPAVQPKRHTLQTF